MNNRHNVVAYLATLAAIVIMSIVAAIICVSVEPDSHLAQIVAALGFIGAAVTGLIGVIGTFKARDTSETVNERLIAKLPPADPVALEERP
jgi:multisubunit Na+/H+ antiporter MnhC subunit